jgi:S1-C subfamily serine protease
VIGQAKPALSNHMRLWYIPPQSRSGEVRSPKSPLDVSRARIIIRVGFPSAYNHEMIRSARSQIVIGVLAGLLLQPILAQSKPQAVPLPPAKLVPSQGPKTPREIAQEAFPSVVILVLQDSKGQPTSLGSGFVLRDGLVVTNRHVIEGAASGYSRIVGASTKYTIAGTVAVDDAHDLAIVAVNGLKAPALPIGNSSDVAVGDDVYAVGNPQGLEGTFSQGIVSAVRRVEGDTILQITSPISPGSSGGPILNNRGQAIGIAVATFMGGQNLNLAIPSSYLTALAANVSADVRPLSRPPATSEKRSIISDLGEPSVQGVLGESLLWAFPGSQIYGDFTFSLRNQLQQAVKDVDYLVVFFGGDQNPVDVVHLHFPGPIPAGLAVRLSNLVDGSVNTLVHSVAPGGKRGHVEIRILDFRLAE